MSQPDRTLLLYQRPTLLRQDQHRNLKLTYDGSDFSFASQANSFLLAATEIPEASLQYPVVFIGKEGGAYSLAVLVGLTDRQNLFVDASGRWAADSYVPAFVRRYPFVLLEEGPDRLSVGFDAAYPGFGDNAEQPLFEDGGAPSPLLQHAIGFLEGFHAEMTLTRTFADRLAALGVLVPRVVEVSSGPRKAPRVLQGFYAVDPGKLAALPAAELAALASGPELSWIYLHLNSLRLVNRLAARVDALGARDVFPADAPVNVGTLPNQQPAAAAAGDAPVPAASGKAAKSARPGGRTTAGQRGRRAARPDDGALR
ncbi:MAG: SapC family protein [Pseudomonadota bacterium]